MCFFEIHERVRIQLICTLDGRSLSMSDHNGGKSERDGMETKGVLEGLYVCFSGS